LSTVIVTGRFDQRSNVVETAESRQDSELNIFKMVISKRSKLIKILKLGLYSGLSPAFIVFLLYVRLCYIIELTNSIVVYLWQC